MPPTLDATQDTPATRAFQATVRTQDVADANLSIGFANASAPDAREPEKCAATLDASQEQFDPVAARLWQEIFEASREYTIAQEAAAKHRHAATVVRRRWRQLSQELVEHLQGQLKPLPLLDDAGQSAVPTCLTDCTVACSGNPLADWRAMRPSEIGLSPGVCFTLHTADLYTVGALDAHLQEFGHESLLQLRGIGPVRLKQILHAIEASRPQ